MGEAGLPASGCSGRGLPEFAIYEANLEPCGSTAIVLFAFKTKRTKQQLWHNHQQQIHSKQSKVLSPLHREKLEHWGILFHKERDAWLCVPQNLVASGSFNTSLMTYLAPFKLKNPTTADAFPPSKSQEKHNKICRGGLSELTPGNKDNQEHCFEEFPGKRVCYEWLSVTKTAASWKQSSISKCIFSLAWSEASQFSPKRVLNATVLPNLLLLDWTPFSCRPSQRHQITCRTGSGVS